MAPEEDFRVERDFALCSVSVYHYTVASAAHTSSDLSLMDHILRPRLPNKLAHSKRRISLCCNVYATLLLLLKAARSVFIFFFPMFPDLFCNRDVHVWINKSYLFSVLAEESYPAIPLSPPSPANCAKCAAWSHAGRARLARGRKLYLTCNVLNHCLALKNHRRTGTVIAGK